MTNFKLTTESKHYVNAAGDKCEVALLNGVWVAVWRSGIITTHTDDGQCWDLDAGREVIYFNITAKLEGWRSNPFIGAPDWVEYITTNQDGRYFMWEKEPFQRGKVWDKYSGKMWEIEGLCYQGNWRNSLIKRGEWNG